jgi:hypothetical protein
MFPFRTVGLLAGNAWADDATPAASLLPPLPSLGASELETLASPLPAMFIARTDSHVCTAWLTRLVRIAHRSLWGGTTVWGG